MTLIRWSPIRTRPVADFRTEMDRLFDGLVGDAGSGNTGSLLPPVDIEETPEAFVLRVDLPGLAAKDVKVSLEGDTLTLRGERKREASASDGQRHRTERLHGTFERAFTLSSPVRGDQVKASYRDGVLEIRVPKAEEAKVREIEVQVG